MSTHTARILWEGGEAPFTSEEYPRDHRVEWGTGTGMLASAAPDYRGNPALTNPEELLVGAVSSCHMLTFLAVCARKGFHVHRYTDDAAGELEKGENGRMQITRILLSPRAEFQGAAPDRETLEKLHAQAHRGCFVANSVRCEVVTHLD